MLLSLTFLLSFAALPSLAEGKASDREELFGVWYMEWRMYDKEEEMLHIKNTNYTCVKVYRSNGEYACLEAWLKKDGSIRIVPHEYGTYSFKNGEYIEMGRKMIPGKTSFFLINEDTRAGRWNNCVDQSKKIKKCPKALEQYFVDCCQLHIIHTVEKADIEKMIKKYIFKVK